ncbi:MAG: hypothetical protein HYU81_01265 [Candidatus Brennerbacteria bacterium]|nr:hypothetical protein [Candidatus Brennerbacteria bacterium]
MNQHHGASGCSISPSLSREDEEGIFGKDEGVIHEAIVTGRKVGAGKKFWAALAHNERLFRKTVEFVARGGNGEPTSQKIARLIMGPNFRSVEEVFAALNRKLTERDFNALTTIPYSEETLEECRETHLLRPEFPINLIDLSLAIPDVMYRNNLWYRWAEDGTDTFGHLETTSLGWRLIPREATPASVGKSYEEQMKLILPGYEIMNAVTWAFSLALEVVLGRDHPFLGYWDGCWGRSSSVDVDGYRVAICLNGGKVYVSYRWGDNAYSRMGIAVSR